MPHKEKASSTPQPAITDQIVRIVVLVVGDDVIEIELRWQVGRLQMIDELFPCGRTLIDRNELLLNAIAHHAWETAKPTSILVLRIDAKVIEVLIDDVPSLLPFLLRGRIHAHPAVQALAA